AGESVYDRPFQWGSKRTGPDLARIGGRYSDDWHRVHLVDPRAVVPESNMPAFPWLERNRVDGPTVARRMKALQRLGDPYSDEDIAAAGEAVAGKSELDAVVAYLQGLGLNAPSGEQEMMSGIITVVLMLLFVGGWVWAWRPRHKASFDATARLALEED